MELSQRPTDVVVHARRASPPRANARLGSAHTRDGRGYRHTETVDATIPPSWALKKIVLRWREENTGPRNQTMNQHIFFDPGKRTCKSLKHTITQRWQRSSAKSRHKRFDYLSSQGMALISFLCRFPRWACIWRWCCCCSLLVVSARKVPNVHEKVAHMDYYDEFDAKSFQNMVQARGRKNISQTKSTLFSQVRPWNLYTCSMSLYEDLT